MTLTEPTAAVQLRDAVRTASAISAEGDLDLALAIGTIATRLFQEAQGPYRRADQAISEQVLTLIAPGGGRQVLCLTSSYPNLSIFLLP